MSKPLLSLCSVPKVAMRDGYVGDYAHIELPFYEYGFWFASGQQYTFPEGTARQDTSVTLSGRRSVATFQKDCCNCS